MPVNTFFISLLTVEIILYSFLLSLLILMIARRNSAFKGPFYNVFRIVIFADLMNFVCGCIFQKISLIPSLYNFYTANYYFGTVMQSLYPYILVIIFLGYLIMAFNRFTLIWLPLHYNAIWKHQWYTVTLLLLPFLNICWRLFEPATFTYLPGDNVNIKFEHPNIGYLYFLTSTLIYFSTTCLSAILNLLSFIKFAFLKSAAINVNERHLLFVSLITFISQLLRTSYAAQQFFFPENATLNSIFITAFPILNDCFALSGSISFIILSPTARKQFISFYFYMDQFMNQYAHECQQISAQRRNKDPYILFIDGQSDLVVVTAINLKTGKEISNFPFISIKMLSQFVNELYDGDLKGVILSLCKATLPGFSNHYDLFKAIKELFVKRNIPVYNCVVPRLAWTMCIVAANISAKIGDNISTVMAMNPISILTHFQFTKDGYSHVGDGSYEMPENIDELREMTFPIIDSAKIILNFLCSDHDFTAAVKKILRSSQTVIVEPRRFFVEAVIVLYNGFKNRGDIKYTILPNCVYKHQLGFKFGGKDYPLITVKRGTVLPFTQTLELPRSSLVFYIVYEHYTQKIEYTNIISMKNAAHRRQISFTLNEQHLPEYSAKPIILDPIKSLPEILINEQKEIPVIAFFDNSSVICVWNDEKNVYEFLDTWNDMYEFELLVGFNTEKPCYGSEAAAAIRTKPTYVVSDLLNIISKSKKRPFHPYGFKVTNDDDHPVLLEFHTHEKIRKAASPEFLLAMLLKEHKRLIIEKCGIKPSKIGFCLPMMNKENCREERMILINAVEEAFKLVRVESFFIEI